MSNKNSDILIYVPFKKENLNETEINWLNAFQTILKIGLRQITKQGIGITNIISEDSIQGNEEITQNTKIIIQLLINTTYTHENLCNIEHFKSGKIINVICHPDIKEESSKQISSFNLFDESLNKTINLSERIDELKNEIWLKFLDITYEIKKEVSTSAKQPKKLKGKIYVAETSSDQNFNRETIVRELEHLGFEVLPNVKFPKDMLTYSEFVHDNLIQCFLSIHLMGNYYAPLLNNIDISGIELQNDLFHEVAAELTAKNEVIRRLVWIPPDVKPKSEKQKLYIESFKRNIELLKNTEIIQTPIEVFKTIIRNKAEEFVNTETLSKPIAEENETKSVYLISNSINEKNLTLIKEYLLKNKINVLETTHKANKIDLIQEHYHHLINCNALLIDYSVDNIQWLNSKLSDILKSPGFGRKSKFLAKAVLLNSNSLPQLNLNISELDLIDNKEKDIAKRLNSFIEKINKT